MTVKAKILSVFLLYFLKIIQAKDSKIPENFSIGVATSAFQVEGGWNEDGRGLTNWDTYIDNFPEKSQTIPTHINLVIHIINSIKIFKL